MSFVRRRAFLLCTAAVVATITAGCGIRVPHAEVLRASGSGLSAGAAVGSSGSEGSSTGSMQTASAAGSSGTGTGAGPALALAGSGRTGAVTSSGATTGGSSPAAAAGNAPASAAPIAVGNIGTYSGVVGASLSSAQPMIKIWATWVNQHGGINGHRVVVYTADDGGDPSKARALTQQMVEQNHVIAFVGDMISLTSAAVASYLDQVHVPVVGGDVSSPDWNSYPMLFPQGTGAISLYQKSAFLDSRFVHQAGGNNWGDMYCLEDAACSTSYEDARAVASQAGLNPVYGDEVSLTQPSFTAQCLNAASHHVNILTVTVDADSVQRIARDCSAQGFHPLYAAGSLIVTSDLASDPELNGMISIEPTFPWTFSGNPAAQEYQQAVASIDPGLSVSAATSAAWVSGKLFQAALKAVSPSATVTAQDVLNGLYGMHNETLGGLAPPLNFVQGQPAPQAGCYFGVQIQNGHWVALNQGQAYC